jgi:hypothetical protein
MLSPILRTYVNPEESDKVATSNNPHVMYYAPNVSNEDIGGKPPSVSFAGYAMIVGGFYPFVIMPGPHGYMIQLLGLTERASINKEYEEMLGRLCEIKEVWCLPKEKTE